MSFWKKLGLAPKNGMPKHQQDPPFSLSLDDQLAATTDFVSPGNLFQMENGCLSPRSAAAQRCSNHSVPPPQAPPALTSFIPSQSDTPPEPPSPTHYTVVDPEDNNSPSHMHQVMLTEPSFSPHTHNASRTQISAIAQQVEEPSNAHLHHQELQQQLQLEEQQMQRTMEHHRKQYELEGQEQQQQQYVLEGQQQGLHAMDLGPPHASWDAQSSWQQQSGIARDSSPHRQPAADTQDVLFSSLPSPRLHKAPAASDHQHAGLGALQQQQEAASLDLGASGDGRNGDGSFLGGSSELRALGDSGTLDQRGDPGGNGLGFGGSRAVLGGSGSLGGSGRRSGAQSRLAQASVDSRGSGGDGFGVTSSLTQLSVSPPQAVSSVQPVSQAQHASRAQQGRPPEYVNWEGETVYVTQDTLEDFGGLASLSTSYVAPALPHYTPPPPPTHLVAPSDWSVSSTLPSSNALHCNNYEQPGAAAQLPSPSSFMHQHEAAGSQPPIPPAGMCSSRPHTSMPPPLPSPAMQQLHDPTPALQTPTTPLALRQSPASPPMDTGLEQQFTALKLSSAEVEQGLRSQLSEAEHRLKTQGMQLATVHNRAEALQSEVQAGQSRMEVLLAELAMRDGRLESLQAELMLVRKELEQERLRGAEQGVGMDRLKAELLRMRSELEIAHRKLDMSSEDERRLKMEVQGLHKENGMLTDASLHLKMEISESQEKLRALFEDQQRYKAQMARAELSNEGLVAQVQELNLRCLGLEDQTGQLKHELFYTKEDAARSRTQAEVFAKRLLHLRSTMDAAPPPTLNLHPPHVPDRPYSPAHAMPSSLPPYPPPSSQWDSPGGLRDPPPRPLSAASPYGLTGSSNPAPLPEPPYTTNTATSSSLLGNAPPARPPAYSLPPPQEPPRLPPSAYAAPPSFDPSSRPSAYGMPPTHPPPPPPYSPSAAYGSSSTMASGQPPPLPPYGQASPPLPPATFGGGPGGAGTAHKSLNFGSLGGNPKSDAEPSQSTAPPVAPHMQAPFATSIGPPAELKKPEAPQHTPGLDVPFGTERTLQDFLSRSQALEGHVIKLSQEKGQLEAEYAKMPLHGGRTAKERNRKSEVEARIEVLNKAISQQRLALKQMLPRGK